MALAVVGVVVVLALIVGAFVLLNRGETASADVVRLEGMEDPGADPFTPNVAILAGGGSRTTGTGGAATTAPTVAPSSGQRTYTGGQAGLYGGTLSLGSCDKAKLVAFLDQNPDKKAAWARVQGISTAEVGRYIDGLTSVVLRTDTWVTNHGFANGQPTSFSAVLQAGTAVMVDRYGVPRVKCYCGNPLTPPTVYATPTYQGTRWSWFSPSTTVVIKQNVTVVVDFTLLTPDGQPFTRPAGSNGGQDTPGAGGSTPTTSEAPGTSSTTSTTEGPLPTFEVPTTPPRSAPPTTPPPTSSPPPTAPTTTSGPTIDVANARQFFLNSLADCAMSNATRQIVTPQGPNTFSAEADFFVGTQSQHGVWRIQYEGTQGHLIPVNAAAQGCSN